MNKEKKRKFHFFFLITRKHNFYLLFLMTLAVPLLFVIFTISTNAITDTLKECYLEKFTLTDKEGNPIVSIGFKTKKIRSLLIMIL